MRTWYWCRFCNVCMLVWMVCKDRNLSLHGGKAYLQLLRCEKNAGSYLFEFQSPQNVVGLCVPHECWCPRVARKFKPNTDATLHCAVWCVIGGIFGYPYPGWFRWFFFLCFLSCYVSANTASFSWNKIKSSFYQKNLKYIENKKTKK